MLKNQDWGTAKSYLGRPNKRVNTTFFLALCVCVRAFMCVCVCVHFRSLRVKTRKNTEPPVHSFFRLLGGVGATLI